MDSASTQEIAAAPAAPEKHTSFFRQSGWLMVANIVGGFLMWGVHFLAKRLKEGEYGTFGVLISVVSVLPAIPLQMVFAQQTAKAIATGRERELSGTIRLFWVGTTVIWLGCAAAIVFQQDNILRMLKIKDTLGLWLTVCSCLLALWMPMFWGILQGKQNFLWLGWSMMSNGLGRVGLAAVLVFAVGGYAAGMIAGLFFGMLFGTLVAIWQCADLWSRPPLRSDWRPLLVQVIPLMLGFAAFQFLFLADTMFVKHYFTGEQTDAYVGAGTLSRALMWLVGPLAAVMFPRIVHSAAKSEKTDLMRMVLLGTFILSLCGASGLWVLGWLPVRMIYPPQYADLTIELLPWYAFAMIPLSLSNVLLNNLLARGINRAVPAYAVVVIIYVVGLTQFHDSLISVLKVLGCCNLLFLAVNAWYTWRSAPVNQPD